MMNLSRLYPSTISSKCLFCFFFFLLPGSGAQSCEEHPSFQPHYQHPQCSLGGCNWTSPAIQGHLLTRDWSQTPGVGEFPHNV